MKKYKKWIVVFVFIPVVLIFLKLGTAEIKSLANYFLKKSVVDQGGGASQSTNYKLVDAIGQPGGVGAATSTNYKESSGFFSGGEVPQNPVLSVAPTTLDFKTTQTSLTFQIRNTGSGTLTWTVSESPDKPWITSVSPTNGSGNSTITVSVDRSLLIGASDTGNLSVTSNGGNVSVIVQIQAGGIPIYPETSTSQFVGVEFWVDIVVGDNSNPVTDLFGVSFDLNFTNTTNIDVVTPHSNNALSGDFLGNDVVFIATIDEAAGKVSVGISRKAGQGGVNGSGTIARVKFLSNPDTPDGTNILFSLSNVNANDPNGTAIALSPGSQTVIINAGLIVWPGDTNNDGIVNQADVLPLGLFWGSTGPPRPSASIAWSGQPASPWTPENATYADTNGDGTVNQADVLPIGLNWGKTHTLVSASEDEEITEKIEKPTAQTLKMNITGSTKQDQICWVEFVVEGVNDLFGISFELVYSPTTYIDSIEVENGSWLGDDIIFYPNIDMAAAKVSFGISRKAGQGGVSGSGVIATIRMKLKDIPPVETALTIQNVAANDETGNSIQFDVVNHTITVVEEETVAAVPTSFELQQNYPNPFNPETTIEFNLPHATEVNLRIYDINGREIRKLVQSQMPAGIHLFRWDARNNYGNLVSSGIYFYKIVAKTRENKSKSFFDIKKMILMK